MLTTVAYNVLACRGWHPNGVTSDQSATVPSRIVQALQELNPHVITFSEAPRRELIRSMAQALMMDHVRIPGRGYWPGALFTNLDILAFRNARDMAYPAELFTRHMGEVTLAGLQEKITLLSAHLHPGDEAVRSAEVDALCRLIEQALDGGHSVLLQGDLNHEPHQPEYKRWESLGLVDVVANMERAHRPTMLTDGPIRRIDYIWAGGPIATRAKAAWVADGPPFQQPYQTSPEPCLSDHLPIVASFEVGKLQDV